MYFTFSLYHWIFIMEDNWMAKKRKEQINRGHKDLKKKIQCKKWEALWKKNVKKQICTQNKITLYLFIAQNYMFNNWVLIAGNSHYGAWMNDSISTFMKYHPTVHALLGNACITRLILPCESGTRSHSKLVFHFNFFFS